MIRFTHFLIIGLLTVNCCALVAATSETSDAFYTNTPNGEVPPTVVEGTPFAATITITNPYSRAIRITEKNSTCTCNVLEVDDEFLLPGQSTTLRIETPTANKSGANNQRVWLFVSDPDFEALEVRVNWTVQPKVAIDVLPADQTTPTRPEALAYRDIYQLKPHERPDEPQKLVRNILVSTVAEQMPEGGLTVSAEYTGKLWKVTVRKVDELHSLVLLRAAKPDEPSTAGRYQEEVVIVTNHAGKIRIPIELDTLLSNDAGKTFNPFMPE